ncbi:hypothetical protein Purlil1_9876 [Purpureocillium lilacinum]|uniref:Uncharacterized protein n=1 Tax=Purpureocillium lilacinum TaxID=33203 RepID=A0ABR0BP59_PURLI|nr:hypothetical protein Purlil1_9876 [Purpureocillium lilacinum]
MPDIFWGRWELAQDMDGSAHQPRRPTHRSWNGISLFRADATAPGHLAPPGSRTTWVAHPPQSTLASDAGAQVRSTLERKSQFQRTLPKEQAVVPNVEYMRPSTQANLQVLEPVPGRDGEGPGYVAHQPRDHDPDGRGPWSWTHEKSSATVSLMLPTDSRNPFPGKGVRGKEKGRHVTRLFV